MYVCHTTKELRNEVSRVKKERKSIGLVTTMGALHEGHASLIKAARAENDFVIVTVFVNPTQFGPTEDYAAYPRRNAKAPTSSLRQPRAKCIPTRI